MGLCFYETSGTRVCWEQSQTNIYRRWSGRFISSQVVNRRNSYSTSQKCSQKRWERNRQTQEYGGVRGREASITAESTPIIWHGKTELLLDFLCDKYLSPCSPYVRRFQDEEPGKIYRKICPPKLFIFLKENNFPLGKVRMFHSATSNARH